MSKWAWMREYEKDVRARGDSQRRRMVSIPREAWSHRETDPARAQALYEEGLRLAKQLREPWWAMHFAQRIIQARMIWDHDFNDAVRLTVESALEVRKPQYASYPNRCVVFVHLVLAYVGIDPAGYAVAIRKAIGSLERDVPRVDSDDFLVELGKRRFALGLGDLDAADQSASRSLGIAERHPNTRASAYHLTFVYQDLCGIAFKRGELEALADHAQLGEETAKRSGEQIPQSECQLWRALLARQAGDETRAQALRLPAIARMARMKQRPSPHWFNALCAWALHEDDLAAALCVRDLELATCAGRGQLAYESTCHVERCRLLARMGRPLDEVLAAGRAAAGQLRNPTPELEHLERIARGGVGR